MANWNVTESELQALERILLADGCHFAEDAKAVIRCWESKDVAACPGSGKTTVLLAKLKLLGDRMPLENGAGICVLSHTNAAVDEIKKRLPDCSGKLLSYPNYIGTIQSFVDRFVTMPYIRRKFGRTVQPVDAQIYAEHLLQRINAGRNKELQYLIASKRSGNPSIYLQPVDLVKTLYIDSSGSLRLEKQKTPLAGKGRPSTDQFVAADQKVRLDDGIIKYSDTYPLAGEAIAELRNEYTDLFSRRFQYVFIDEYQDCNSDQRDALGRLFDSSRCVVMRIGDPDQAIYSFQIENVVDWIPCDDHLVIESSCRYPQEIANVLVPLRAKCDAIVSSAGCCGHKPVIIVYDDKTISSVLGQFVAQLDQKGLHDPNGIYKAIGFVGKTSVKGRKIGSYWSEFDAGENARSEFRYWAIVDDICASLKDGRLYRAEQLTRKLLCKIFHYAKISDAETSKPFTPNSLRSRLKRDYESVYSEFVLKLAKLQVTDSSNVDIIIRELVDALFIGRSKSGAEIIAALPSPFFDRGDYTRARDSEKNTFIDPIRGRKIQFGTIHSVKGQTHDATLYLETSSKNGTDLGRILCRYGIGHTVSSPIFDYSRKMAYVGFSRPRKLLCIAMQASTYAKSKTAFQNENWEIVDIRSQN